MNDAGYIFAGYFSTFAILAGCTASAVILTRRGVLAWDRKLAAPAIVLVQPQLGENIGFTARAMANFGLHDLRLVAPRDGWPNDKARAAAAGAAFVVDQAKVYDSVEADLP